MIYHGDCLDVLRTLADNCVDAVVTDPPYGLSFMGKRWDYDVPSQEIWAECLRVLKPGGHLLAFAGTRTQHRMTVRIEDAGFEIRDMIAWVYSTGFPKSHNLDKYRGTVTCGCDGHTLPYTHEKDISREQKTECDVHSLRHPDVPQAMDIGERRGEVLQQGLPEQVAQKHWAERPDPFIARTEQPRMEGGCNVEKAERELQRRSICESAGLGEADGAQRWVHHGASASNGPDVRVSSDQIGSCEPHRPQPVEQPPVKPRALPDERRPQAWGGWPVCGGCGKPILPKGFGTALKPALEPITVARKPLTGTVAENVQRWGCGALNIDASRIHSHDAKNGRTRHGGGVVGNASSYELPDYRAPMPAGRWPANLIHDGSDEVVGLFPNETARFFYAPKASKRDRDEGCESLSERQYSHDGRAVPIENAYQRNNSKARNHHPTVKPTDLMRYLVRLVTPPGGTVLDPFAGSGSTGKACALEGFGFIGIEREAEYVEIARARIEHTRKEKPQMELAV